MINKQLERLLAASTDQTVKAPGDKNGIPSEPSAELTRKRKDRLMRGIHRRIKGEEHRAEVDENISPSQKRASTVAEIIKELDILKPQMYCESDYESLQQSNPTFLTF